MQQRGSPPALSRNANPCRTRRPHDDYDGDEGIAVSLPAPSSSSQLIPGVMPGLRPRKIGKLFLCAFNRLTLRTSPLPHIVFHVYECIFIMISARFLLLFLCIFCFIRYNFHGSTLWSLIFTVEKFTTITASVGERTREGQLNWRKASKSRTCRKYWFDPGSNSIRGCILKSKLVWASFIL